MTPTTTLLFFCAVFIFLNGLTIIISWFLVKKSLLYQKATYHKVEALTTVTQHASPSEPTVGELVKAIIIPEQIEKVSIHFNLTVQEKKILFYLLEDYTYKEIADKFCITSSTVNTHAKNIYSKIEVSGKKNLKKKILSVA